MTNHFSNKHLIKYVDRSLGDTKREKMDLHLNNCQECRARLAEVEALQRQVHYSIMAKRQQVRPSLQMTFAAIAPGLNRSRRIAMFVRRSNLVLSVAAAAIVIIALGVGGFMLASNQARPETATEAESIEQPAASANEAVSQSVEEEPIEAAVEQSVEPSLEESQPALDPTLDQEALDELLIEAVRDVEPARVKQLLEAGADPNVEVLTGPIIVLAASQGNADIVNLLADYGADIEAQSSEGWVPLTEAARTGQVAVVELLLDRGVDVNIIDDSWYRNTALGQAAASNHPEVAQLLIDRGADVDLLVPTEWAPLHWAAEQHSVEVARILIDNGADINLQDAGGRTPLHVAIDNKSADVARLLIEAGPDLTIENNAGQTPLALAVYRGQDEIAQMLREAGAEE